MPQRETVSEVIAAATLCVAVPVDRGGELAAGAQEVLESLPIVRYADVREIVEVDADDDGLAATIDCRVTLHVDAPSADGATVREVLRETALVRDVDRFAVVDVPYRIERW